MDWSRALDVAWKTLVVFAVLVALTRIIGRRLLAQLTFFDFVIGVTIGTMGGSYVVTSTEGPYVLLGPAVLGVAVLATGFLSLKSLTFRRLLEGEPTTLIQNGRILRHNLLRARYSVDHLQMELRTCGVFDINEVELAVLEPHGKLSVLRKSQHQPVTAGDLGIPAPHRGLSVDVIKDGVVLESNLERFGLTRAWLMDQLKARSIADPTSVLLATACTDGTLFVSERDPIGQPSSGAGAEQP